MRSRTTRLGLLSLSLGGALVLAACDTGDFNVRYVVGLNGLILNTTNAGSTWTQQASGVHVTLNGVAFAGKKQGCAVGEKATVIRTTDGSTWNAATTVPTTKELNAVDLASNGTPSEAPAAQQTQLPEFVAFAVGKSGTIIYSGDGCDVWSLQTSGTTKTLNGVSTGRCSCERAWAVGDGGTILFTNDLGTTWTAQSSGVKKDLLAVAFASETRGWAVGKDGVILATTDGGTTWTKQTSTTKHTLEGVAAGDGSHAYAVGDDGVIVATSDGGTTWTKQVTHTTTDFDAVSTILNSYPFYTASNGDWHDAIAVGSGGLILTTTDGGVTWTKSNSGTKTSLEGAA
jgi:photosystem II stability/assembly factor-like uncharacterized protein